MADRVVALLSRVGLLSVEESGLRLVVSPVELHARTLRIVEELNAVASRDVARIDQVSAFVETTGCRVRAIESLFGIATDRDCGTCSTCTGTSALPEAEVPSRRREAARGFSVEDGSQRPSDDSGLRIDKPRDLAAV